MIPLRNADCALRNGKGRGRGAGLARCAAAILLLASAPAASPGTAGEVKVPARAEVPAPESQEAARRGEALLREGRTREAVDLLREAAGRDPRNPSLQFVLGRALTRARDYDGAIAALQAGLALAPHNLLARKGLAEAQRKKGDLAGARATLEAIAYQTRDVAGA